MVGGMVVICFAFFIMGIVFKGCIDYHKEIKEELEREKTCPTEVKECTFEDVARFVREMNPEEEEKPLDQLFLDWLASEDKGVDLTQTADPYVEVEQPCIGNECAQSPAREDCCTGDYDHGKCKIVININKLVGIDETIKRDPKLLTPSEAEMLARSLTQYLESQHDN